MNISRRSTLPSPPVSPSGPPSPGETIPTTGTTSPTVPEPTAQNTLAAEDQLEALPEMGEARTPALPFLDALENPGETVLTPLPGMGGVAKDIPDEKMVEMLDTYNTELTETLKNAPEGSVLRRYQSAMRLMSMLENPELLEDVQARDALEMRRYKKDDIAEVYNTLAKSPEVRQAFDQARQKALNATFDNPQQASKAFANHLRSEPFLNSLKTLPPDKAQEKLNGELAKLSALNPRLAQEVSEQILEVTIAESAFAALRGADKTLAAQAENGIRETLDTYLKFQQSGAGVTHHLDNIAMLRHLPDEAISDLSQALARVARNVRVDDLKDNDKLARELLANLDELQPQQKVQAQALIKHMRHQGILNTVLLAGSIAGIAASGVPKDNETWAALAAGGLDVVSNSHHALRLAGLQRGADFLNKVNYTPEVIRAADHLADGSRVVARFPLIGLAASGLGLAADGMALYRETQNEDVIGQATRVAGLASGAASIAAVTVMSGPAAPITLIGATTVGLAAWAIDATWGESELTGQVRQDLRTLGISTAEEDTTKELTTRPSTSSHPRYKNVRYPLSDTAIRQQAQQSPLQDRVALINQYMDERWTDRGEETLIFNVLKDTPDKDFLPLIEMLDTGKLANEIENETQAATLLDRMASAYEKQNGQPAGPKLSTYLQRLTEDHREGVVRQFLKRNPEAKAALPPEVLKTMTQNLMNGGTDGTEEYVTQRLLTEATATQFDGVMAQADTAYFDQLVDELETYQVSNIINKALWSSNPDTRAQGMALYDRLKDPFSYTVKRGPHAGKRHVYRDLGSGASATERFLKRSSNTQLAALPRDTVEQLGRDLKTYYDRLIFPDDAIATQIARLEGLGYNLD